MNQNAVEAFDILSQRYLEWMRVQNYTPSSLKTMQRRLTYFLNWCEQHEITNPLQVTHNVIYMYRKHVMNSRKKSSGKKLSIKTRSNYLGAVRCFFKWLAQTDRILCDPADNLHLPKRGHHLPKVVLNREEVEQIINTPDVGKPLGIRDRAMLEVLYSCGLRARELAHLSIHDVDLAQGIILVQEGKGRKDRVVPVGERACQWLSKYLVQVRGNLYRPARGLETALFLTIHGKPWKYKALSYAIARYVRQSGISKRGACHIFRHAMATHMLENGADIRYIQQMLGHADLNTTQIYTRVNVDKLKAVHGQTHPAGKTPGPALSPMFLANPTKRPYVQSPKRLQSQKVRENPAPGTLAERANKFLEWLEVSGYSCYTIITRRRQLSIFLKWCEERAISRPETISKSLLYRYQNHLYNLRGKNDERPLSTRYRLSLLCTIRVFFAWLSQTGQILFNPAESLELPRKPHHLPRQILTPDEVRQVFDQPDISTTVGIRDRAILETLYSTGIRREELQKLTIKDVDYREATLRVHSGKSQKERIIPIGESALGWIKRYVEAARPVQPPTKILFLSSSGVPLHPEQISSRLRKYVSMAHIGKTGSCHIFRHSMATHMLENGADIRYIQEMLGHTNLRTTQIYTRVSILKLKQVHSKTHPAKLKPGTGPKPEPSPK